MAPFTLVTNGHDFRLYDTVTKTLIPDTTTVSGEFAVALPDKARNEALELFLGRSPANVLRLSASQVELATSSLKGEPTNFGAVHISAAHRPNPALLAAIPRFLESTSGLFVMVGEAGAGKTCAAVDIAASLLSAGYPAFFFQGGMLQSDVLEAVWSEVTWPFNEQSDRVQAPYGAAAESLHESKLTVSLPLGAARPMSPFVHGKNASLNVGKCCSISST